MRLNWRLKAAHKIIMEITLLIMEKSWNNHGILILNFCGNPDSGSSDGHVAINMFIISPGQSVLLQDEAQHSGLSDGHVAINVDDMEPRHRHQLQLIDEQVSCLS